MTSSETKLSGRRGFGALIDWAVKKQWSDEDIQKYVGSYQSAHLCYSTDETIRKYSASGGTTTHLLHDAIMQGAIDGAVVCKTVLVDGKVRPHFYIATDLETLLAAQGSKYVETRFLNQVLPLIRGFEGRLAVVGLPCDLSALKRWQGKDDSIGSKVAFTIGLVCGHNSRTELIDNVTRKLEKQAGAPLKDYMFRYGPWRGKIRASFEDGQVMTPPTKQFNDYQNLFFFCERKCLACHDHYAYDADITIGDVWLYKLKSDPIKKSGLIVRTEAGQRAFGSAVQNGVIDAEALSVRDIMDGQSRIGPSHYNTSARAKLGKFFGFKLKDTVNERVKWHSYLNAAITLANIRLSESALGKRIIFAMPRPIFRGYLYLKKGLETLR